MPAAVSKAFVIANIDIAILPRTSNFLVRGEKRKVIVKRGNDLPEIMEMTGTEIRTMLDQSKRQRSRSPRKRLRNPDGDDEPGDVLSGKRLCSDRLPNESQNACDTDPHGLQNFFKPRYFHLQ
jgi:hypothetical protein